MKRTLAFLIIFFPVVAGLAQSNPLDKKLEKAYSLANDGKITEADKYVTELLEKNPDYGTGWDLLAKIRYKEYKDAKLSDNLLSGNITVTTTGKDGKEVKSEDDSLAQSLMKLLNDIKPSKKAWSKYIYTMRKGTLLAPDAYECSSTLRIYFIDPEVDTAVSKKALNYFNKAEEEFQKKDYEKAMKHYQQAINAQPDFYKASLYLGDAHYFMGHYIQAIASFKDAIQKFPSLVEPRKYLIDAYAKERLYKDCLDASIEAMMVYPDHSLIDKLEDAVYMNEKKLAFTPVKRPVLPNTIDMDTMESNNTYYEEIKPAGPWTYYTKALGKISSYCNKEGLIEKPTSLTKSKYLEVYSWEEMLNNSQDPSLETARQMQKDGYLDCYVLVSCFHYDLYDQYSAFVKANKVKINEYYQKYMIPR